MTKIVMIAFKIFIFMEVLQSISFSGASEDSYDEYSISHYDETHEVPGEPLSPLDFKNAEKLSLQTDPSGSVDPTEKSGQFEGDIVQNSGSKSGKASESDTTKTWPNAVVPYMISARFNEHERSIIARAIMEFHRQTCISFKPRSKEPDYVMLSTGEGCSSHVGQIGGAQNVTLGSGCVHPGIVMHELLHAVGLWHEQSRWDRDEHVTVIFENIQKGMEGNFRKISWKEMQALNVPYDTSSIMHYGPYTFSINRQKHLKTIVPKYPNDNMGQRSNFSEIDVYKVNKLYKCQKKGGSNETNSNSSGNDTTPGGAQSTSTTFAPESGSASKCSDNHKNCQKWASNGECQKNPNWMLVNCKYSCNQCRSACSNTNKHCESWASSGECSKNPGYMHEHCPKACKTCK